MPRQYLMYSIMVSLKSQLNSGKIIRVSKENVKSGMELYLPGVVGPITVTNVTITDAGVRLHTNRGAFEFGPSDTNCLARSIDKSTDITKRIKLCN